MWSTLDDVLVARGRGLPPVDRFGGGGGCGRGGDSSLGGPLSSSGTLGVSERGRCLFSVLEDEVHVRLERGRRILGKTKSEQGRSGKRYTGGRLETSV